MSLPSLSASSLTLRDVRVFSELWEFLHYLGRDYLINYGFRNPLSRKVEMAGS